MEGGEEQRNERQEALHLGRRARGGGCDAGGCSEEGEGNRGGPKGKG